MAMNIDAEALRDEVILCIDCGRLFTWSAGEQAFYLSKQLSPRLRCKNCLEARKARLVPDSGLKKEGMRENDRHKL